MAFKAAVIPAQFAKVNVETVAAIPTPGEGEIVIKNYAVASNPIDWKIQKYSAFFAPNDFPTVLGEDVAGVVESVGPGVTSLKKGDRVLSFTPIIGKKQFKYGAFQEYTVSLAQTTAKIPDSVNFDQASTIPLGISTAITALYDDLKLEKPKLDKKGDHKNEWVLVWGGSSSVGSYAVQLAVRAGYKVISTASKHNHDLVKSFGADVVIDYNDADVVEQIKKAAGAPIKFAVDAITGNGSTEKVAAAVDVHASISLVLKAPADLPSTLTVKQTFAGRLFAPEHKELAEYFFHQYLETALKQSLIVPNKVEVLPNWIDGVQDLLDKHAAGVSGKKLVLVRP